jgi:transmembrane sensor
MKPADQRANPASANHVINDAAASWFARREAGFNPRESAEFLRWCETDVRHAAAFERAEAAHRLLARLPESPAAAAMLAEVNALCSAREPVVPFSTVWKSALGLAAAAAVALVFWSTRPDLDRANATYTTAAGHHQSISLPDGSTLILNSHSEVSVAFEPAERRVRLQHGEAHFYVAKDPARPFLVSAGSVTVRAVGTAFNVRRQAAAIEVLVTEGKVQVTREDAPHLTASELEPIFLAAGERAFIDNVPASTLAAGQAPASSSERSTPRAPRLMFNNTPLSDVVERFNPYSRVQMEIADPDLAHHAVGGTFDADKAESFINLLITAGDVRVERVSETKVLLHKPDAK